MALSIEQSLLPFVGILLVLIMYFAFLRRVAPEAKAGTRRETFTQTVITPQPQAKTAKPANQPQPEAQTETETPVNEVEQEETIPAPQPETPKVIAKPRREGLFKRARRSKPTATIDPKKPLQGKVPFCPKYLGYLGTLPKGSPYPDQCLGCRKVVTCIGLQRGEAIESIYLEEEVTAR